MTLNSLPSTTGDADEMPSWRARPLIECAVADVFGVMPDELARASRGRARAAFARQVAMYVTHISCGLSMQEVGILFARDRTTVRHACRLVEDRRDDPVLDRAVELLAWAVPTLVAYNRAARAA